jgi:hypothetical protein
VGHGDWVPPTWNQRAAAELGGPDALAPARHTPLVDFPVQVVPLVGGAHPGVGPVIELATGGVAAPATNTLHARQRVNVTAIRACGVLVAAHPAASAARCKRKTPQKGSTPASAVMLGARGTRQHPPPQSAPPCPCVLPTPNTPPLPPCPPCPPALATLTLSLPAPTPDQNRHQLQSKLGRKSRQPATAGAGDRIRPTQRTWVARVAPLVAKGVRLQGVVDKGAVVGPAA